MIYVGLDDTDTLETPGTNKLALYLAEELAADFETRLIVRHQLLVDPRVPCTNKNGCASMQLLPRGAWDADRLFQRIAEIMLPWCPEGSDPGLCLTEHVPEELVRWGRRAQTELLNQPAALALARQASVRLAPLGGTGDGVVGALAAVGLVSTGHSGRVVYCGKAGKDAFDLTGCHEVRTIRRRGVDELLTRGEEHPVTSGRVELGKRLRPNLRGGRIVLYVTPTLQSDAEWEAVRVREDDPPPTRGPG